MKDEFRDMEMVRNVRNGQYQRVKNLSREEKLAFYRRQAQKLFQKLGIDIEFVKDQEKTSGAMH